jgi:hypothetical protein
VPSRVIREGLLDSPRYWSVPVEARDFFIRLLLVADDFGCFNASRLFIGRRCFLQPPSDAKLEKLYRHLASADLVRFYFAGDEKTPTRYGFIPRFRQTQRQVKARHPRPPDALYHDDSDAVKKFTQYKDLFREMPSSRTTDAAQAPGIRGAGLGVGLGVGCGVGLGLESGQGVGVGQGIPLPLVAGSPPDGDATALPPFLKVEKKLNGNPDNQPHTVDEWALFLAMERYPGEQDGPWTNRVVRAKQDYVERRAS